MSKTLITYFSASGITKKVAEKMASSVNGDLFEIEPKEKYTKEDLEWHNKESRSSIEMNDKSSRPEVVRKVENLEDYDKVVIGFPVWWYTAPTIINTFIEENNLEGKEIYIFVTSGGSNADGSIKDLRKTYPNLNFVKSTRYTGAEYEEVYQTWIKEDDY